MQLVFVRHAEPDYSVDSLTPEGFREAAALARRAAKWKGRVTACFQSPHGRARDTAAPCLEALGMEAETLPWLREFAAERHLRPDGSEASHFWDLLPSYRTEQPRLAEPEGWTDAPYPGSVAGMVRPMWEDVKRGIDGILGRYGYVRDGGLYRVEQDARRDATLVFFCHLGLAGAVCGHVLGIAPPQLWHAFFIPPSGVTVLNSEERVPGTAAFRCQVMGDTSHLRDAGLAVSQMGGFGPVFSD